MSLYGICMCKKCLMSTVISVIVIGGEMGGGRAESPSFSNVYTFQHALHNKKKPHNYCQKASETLSES